jgi:hypothetical protein
MLFFHIAICGQPTTLKMKLKYHWRCILILLQHAKCIASFICIESYVVDLWSWPYRYNIMGCSFTPCWVCRQESFCIGFICIHEVYYGSDLSMLKPYHLTMFQIGSLSFYFDIMSSGNSMLNWYLIQLVVWIASQNKFACWDVSSYPCFTQSRYLMLTWEGRGLAARHTLLHLEISCFNT